jgi:hypothetical protein
MEGGMKDDSRRGKGENKNCQTSSHSTADLKSGFELGVVGARQDGHRLAAVCQQRRRFLVRLLEVVIEPQRLVRLRS